MAEYILEMNGITKTFPGVKALDNVNLKVKKGEIPLRTFINVDLPAPFSPTSA